MKEIWQKGTIKKKEAAVVINYSKQVDSVTGGRGEIETKKINR